jgi:hypothetical protein
MCIKSQTTAAINLRMVLSRLNIDVCTLRTHSLYTLKQRLISKSNCDDLCSAIGEITRELCLMRDGVNIACYDDSTLSTFIDSICTS